jgi:predicted RNA-binding protein with TRAM domain
MPVKLSTTIGKITSLPNGVARIQGFVVFVKDGKPGQKLRVQVDQVGNTR